MCELCDAGYASTGNGGYIEFPETITEAYISKNPWRDGPGEVLIINDKWMLLPTGDMNEAYGNDLLTAYQKISDTFDDFTKLMRMRVPYESWPLHCRIAGLNPDSLGPVSNLGCDPRGTPIQKTLQPQPQQIPIAPCAPPEDNTKDVWDLLREKGFNPLQAFPTAVISRIEDIGRAQAKLKSILDSDIFNRSAFDKSWVHKDKEFDDKLDSLRMEIRVVEDNLWDLWAILRNEEE